MDMVTVRNFLEPYGVFSSMSTHARLDYCFEHKIFSKSSMSTHAKLRKISVEKNFIFYFL